MDEITYTVKLVFDGVDFDADETWDAFAEHENIRWSGHDGLAYATVTRPGRDAVSVAMATIKEIETTIPSSKFRSADREFVSVSDVAERAGVHRESARLWSEGLRGPGNFPKPVAVVSGRMRLWQWSEVNAWLLKHLGLGEDVTYPTTHEFTQIDILAMPTAVPPKTAWRAGFALPNRETPSATRVTSYDSQFALCA